MVGSSFAYGGVSAAMNDSQNDNVVDLHSVHNFIGESFDDVLPCPFIFGRMGVRVSFNKLKTRFNLQQDVIAESQSGFLIPGKCIL